MHDLHSRELLMPSPAATDELASRLAPLLGPGEGIALTGDLGAGKTAFARAFLRTRLDPDLEVPSPTFTLVQIYEDTATDPPVEIWHVDLYRITDPEEAVELGLEDAFSSAICLIEWPERLGSGLPANFLSLTFRFCDNPEARIVTLSAPAAMQDRLHRAGITAQDGAAPTGAARDDGG